MRCPCCAQYEIEAFVEMVQTGKQQDCDLTWDLAMGVAQVMEKARLDAGIRFPADDAAAS